MRPLPARLALSSPLLHLLATLYAGPARAGILSVGYRLGGST